jgi:hypothetical protein
VVDFRKTVKASLLLFDDRQRYTALKHVARAADGSRRQSGTTSSTNRENWGV